MIVDTSAVFAIVFNESDAERLFAALSSAPQAFFPASCVVEWGIQLDRIMNDDRRRWAADSATGLNLTVLPITASVAALARQAHARYGRYSGSPARLNFGDCFSYALARERDEPLLFKGNDFVHTDVRVA